MDTEDKIAWCKLGEESEILLESIFKDPSSVAHKYKGYEQAFLHGAEVLRSNLSLLRINPEKRRNKYAIDFEVMSRKNMLRKADLKCNRTPRFSAPADFSGLWEPEFIVAFNKHHEQKEEYKDTIQLFWRHWHPSKRGVVNESFGLYYVRFEDIPRLTVASHNFQRRVNDSKNAKGVHYLDTRSMGLLAPLPMPFDLMPE